MKLAEEMADRLRGMLTRDKIGVKEGFMTALNNDLNRLLGDYFELEEECGLNIEQDTGGNYLLTLGARASKIKSFESTVDLKMSKH